MGWRWGGDGVEMRWRWGGDGGRLVSGIWYLVDPPEAPTQPEGFPENVGHPTATWRLTRSRQGGSKRAAHARTLRHQGLTPAVVLGVWGGGGSAGLGVRLGSPRVEWVASRGCQSRHVGVHGVPPLHALPLQVSPKMQCLKSPCCWWVGFPRGFRGCVGALGAFPLAAWRLGGDGVEVGWRWGGDGLEVGWRWGGG